MNNGGRTRFCQNCGDVWQANHTQVCRVLQAQRNQGAPQAPRQQGVDYAKEISSLVRRIQALESARITNPAPAGLAQLHVRHPRQPQGTVNRVFTATVGTVLTNPTENWTRVGELDINDQMTGFQAWAAQFVRVSITSLMVVYTPAASNIPGIGVVALGFDVASAGQGTATNIITMDRKVFSPMANNPAELFVHYEERTPFERWLKGAQASHVPRDFGRVFLMRSARQWMNPAGQAINIAAGFVHVYVQCACLRPAV